MANSAGDARGSELDIRRELLKSGAVDVMVSIGPNFFYTEDLENIGWCRPVPSEPQTRSRLLAHSGISAILLAHSGNSEGKVPCTLSLCGGMTYSV